MNTYYRFFRVNKKKNKIDTSKIMSWNNLGTWTHDFNITDII